MHNLKVEPSTRIEPKFNSESFVSFAFCFAFSNNSLLLTKGEM